MGSTASTRDRLLEAAARLFLERGYADASMDQVRQAAGVSNGSLYHHFATKVELADALYAGILQDVHGALLSALRRADSAEPAVKGLVRSFVTWVVKHPGRAALLHKLKREGEVTDESAPVSAANAQAIGGLKSWVEQRRASGEIADLPFHLWMALVFAPSMSLARRWVRDERPSVPARVRTALEDAAWAAVRPAVSAASSTPAKRAVPRRRQPRARS